MDESLNQFRCRYIKHLHEQLDGRIIIFGGSPRGKARAIVRFALANQIPILLHPQPTVKDAFNDLKKRIELFEEESRFAAVRAENISGWIVQTKPLPSRRGRNIKSDESRRARYSQPRNR